MDSESFSTGLSLGRELLPLIRLKATYLKEKEFSEHIRRSVCDYQIGYINFHYTASELHRQFRIAYQADPDSDDSKTAFQYLTRYIEFNTKRICVDLAEKYVREFFLRSRFHAEPPRVGIHVSDENGFIHEVSSRSGTPTAPKSLDDYTCFSEVMSTGIPYLVNDFPLAIKNSSNGIKHGSLESSKVKLHYTRKFRDYFILSRIRNNYIRKSFVDVHWNSLAGVKRNGDKYYKSHLILPITFWGHSSKYDYSDKLKRVLCLKDDGRSVIGFLCVDHPATHYFDGEPSNSYCNVDINICYLFADLVSFVFVTKLMYTDQSDTYRSYKARNKKSVEKGGTHAA